MYIVSLSADPNLIEGQSVADNAHFIKPCRRPVHLKTGFRLTKTLFRHFNTAVELSGPQTTGK